MINPGDLALIGTEEGAEMFPPELLTEFEDNSDGAEIVTVDMVGAPATAVKYQGEV